MNQDGKTTLREQILSDIPPLVLATADEGMERFSLLLRLIQAGTATDEIYQEAYENAKAIEDKRDQLNALMALLDEISYDIQKSDSVDIPTGEQSPASSAPSADAGSDTVSQTPVQAS